MKVAYVLYHIARADFLERVRRYSFLLTLGFAGFVVLQAYTGHIYLSLGDYSGSASSAWFGAFLGLVAATFLSLTGFYIVKNTIQRDELTRVGRILAATPMTRLLYIAGKALSNFAVLAAMVFVLALAATAMQLLRGHGGIDFWELLSPFILLALPVMATVAALAVLFETLPILRGGVGNVAYFFLWSGFFSTAFTVPALDFTGVSFLIQSMGAVVKKLDPSYHGAFTLQAGGAPTAAHRFQWDGLHWTSGMVLQRLLWVGVAIALTCLAALFFRRFDPAREAGQSRRKKQPAAPGPQTDLIPILGTVSARTSAHLTPLPRGLGSSFLALVRAELRVMLKGVSRWWYLVALGLWIASVLTPLEASRNILIAIWIWPLLLWSAMGTREGSCQTSAFIFSSPRSLQRQLPAVWLAGVIVALTTGSGVALRLAIAADFHGVFAWLAGALFIPTLALTLGVCSGTSKTFEAVYTFWWYTGPANHIPYVDFMGISASSGRPEFYFLLVAVLLVIAFAGRRARLAYA